MKKLNLFRSVTSTLRFLTGLLVWCGCIHLKAQINYSDFISSGENRSYNQVAVHERRAIAAAPIRDSDIKFSRRIVRCIDARQKINKQIEWPRKPLNALLYAGLCEGAIIPFRSDSLQTYYNNSQIKSRGAYEKLIWLSNNPEDPDDGHDTLIWIDYDYTRIHKFWVMEDWVFDAKYSMFRPHIIALAPIFRPVFSEIEGPEQPLCWIRMEDIRQLLSNTEMFNRYNDAARLSYDDFFQMRIFDSYIVYESNVFDSFIHHFEEYENEQFGALLKSDEVKNDLFIFEHDLWQF